MQSTAALSVHTTTLYTMLYGRSLDSPERSCRLAMYTKTDARTHYNGYLAAVINARSIGPLRVDVIITGRTVLMAVTSGLFSFLLACSNSRQAASGPFVALCLAVHEL